MAVGPADLVSQFARQLRNAGHEGAADPQDMNAHYVGLRCAGLGGSKILETSVLGGGVGHRRVPVMSHDVVV